MIPRVKIDKVCVENDIMVNSFLRHALFNKLFNIPLFNPFEGNDVGSQYASAIFVNDEEQRKIVTKVISQLQDALDNGKVSYSGKRVLTDVHDSTEFYEAHDEHQEYLMKNPSGYW